MRQSQLSPLEAAEPTCLAHDEFTVLEEARPADVGGTAAAGGVSAGEGVFDIEDDAENMGARTAAAQRPPQQRSGTTMLRTLADRPDELLQWGECGSDCSSDWDASAPASPMRRPGSTGLGTLTPAGSPLRNQSPHRGLPPLSPNKVAPVCLYMCCLAAGSGGQA